VNAKPRFEPLGDQGLLATFGEAHDGEAVATAAAFSRSVMAKPLPGLRDCVPAYASLAVYYDPATVIAGSRMGKREKQQVSAYTLCQEYMTASWQGFHSKSQPRGKLIVIQAYYGGAAGADLSAVARSLGLSEDEVIQIHAKQEYTVQAIGFAPGFPYMSGLDPRLTLPRKDTPNTRVEAGSIGVAGQHTGIYPVELPGGWHIIGRTMQVLFDPDQYPPAMLEPGDRVRFEPMSADREQSKEVSP